MILLAAAVLAAGAWAAPAQAAPAGVTAIALDGRVELAWQLAAGATAYTIYRGTTPTAITTLVSPLGGVVGPGFVDTGAVNGTTYYYAVRAVVAGAESDASAPVRATPVLSSCSTGTPVALENCYPGDAAWNVTDARGLSAGGIEGFATATSIDRGGAVDLKVNTAAGVPYRVEIYRSGYYGGARARLFSVLHGLSGVSQPPCLTDTAAGGTGLVDCSGWSSTATITTTAAWPSGVYLLRLVREDNGSDSHVLVVVRDDARRSDLLYTVTDTTYQAYNNYGGKSLYDYNSTGLATVSGTQKAVKVSFDRPYEQVRSGDRNWYKVTDQALVLWLEREGYDVAYQSDLDLERRAVLAQNHAALVVGVHDEYYSAGMRAALEQARDAGVSLFSIGSNELYWKIRFEPSPVSGAAERVQVTYKTTSTGVQDPSGIPTGTWRDPGGANRPENALVGQLYVGDDSDDFFPLVVSAAEGTDRVYRYTGLDSQPAGTSTAIGTSLVGWEWNARVANGAEPPGVKTLASSPVTGNLIQGDGAFYTIGPSVANVTKYTAASGALVFATGTNHWSRGLALNPAGVGEPDRRIQQTTVNVLADMGALPVTPSASITLDSATAPRVVTTTPADAAVAVPTTSTVSAAFSRALDATTITASSFTLKDAAGAAVPATVAYDAATATARLTPAVELVKGVTYTARLETTVLATDGSPLASPVTWIFTTIAPGSTVRINVGGGAITTVAGDAFGADANFAGGSVNTSGGAIAGTSDDALYRDERWGSFRYALPVQNATYDVRLHFVELYYGTVVSGAPGRRVFSVDLGDTPTLDVKDLDIYAEVGANAALVKTIQGVTVGDGVLELSSVYGPADDPEIAAIEIVPSTLPPGTPTVVNASPGDGTAGVAAGIVVTAGFSRAMNAATITATSFSLKRPDGTAVPATVSYDALTSTATLTPSAPLADSTTYTATLASTIAASDGTPLAGPFSWAFTTVVPGQVGLVRINAGGGAVTTGDGRVFGADAQFTGGSVHSSAAAIAGTTDDALYQDERWGNFSYVVPLASGTYDVRLHFVELYYGTLVPGAIGSRVFGIDLLDTVGVDLQNLDIYAEVGPNAALVKTIPSVVVSDGALNIQSVYGSADDPELAAIEIVPVQGPPTVSGTTPTNAATGVGTDSTVTATFSRSMDATTITSSSFTLTRSDGMLVAGAISYDATARRATLTPAALLAHSRSYTARLVATIGASDGTALAAPVTWSFTTGAPRVTSTAPAAGAFAAPRTTEVAATFSSSMDPATITASSFTLTPAASATAVAATVTYDSATRTAKLVPTARLAAGTDYTARLYTSVRAADGAALAAAVTWTFTTAACPCTLFSITLQPSIVNISTLNGRDPAAGPYSLELGVKVIVDEPTNLTAVRFYKDALETGTHTATVWTADGSLKLAQVAFAGETASGWQTQALATPVALEAGKVYVVSVNANASFVQTFDALAAAVVSGPLRSVADGQNGVFADAAETFPTQSHRSSNYFVDVEVVASGASTPLTVTATSPAGGATGVARTTSVRATFSRSVEPATVTSSTFTLRKTADGTAVGAALAYDGATKTAVLTPSSALAAATMYTAALTIGVRATDGAPLATQVEWSFTTADAPAPTVTLTVPAGGADDLGTAVKPRAEFSQALDPATVTAASFTLTGPAGAVAGTVAYDGATRAATFSPAAPLQLGATYTARLDGAITSLEGKALGTPYSWSFTVAASEPGAPAVGSTSPAGDATGVARDTQVMATFSRSMDPATITAASFSLTAAGSATPVAATVAYNAVSRVATLTPTAMLPGGTALTARVAASVTAADGTPLAGAVSWTFTTAACPCTLFSSSVEPTFTGVSTVNGRDPAAGPYSLELGVKVTVDEPMHLTAVRFYRDALETGVHTATVWTADGTLKLAQVPFATETASGWQTQALPAPLSLSAGTVYVVSVNANSSFVQTFDALATAVVSGPLRSVADGQNGVFADAAGLFPTQSFRSSSYHVDLEVSAPAPPRVVAKTPATGATGVSRGTIVSARFSRSLDPATVSGSTVTLAAADGTAVAATVAYDATTSTAVLTPASPLAFSTTYTATLTTGIRGSDGLALAAAEAWSFTTEAAPPTVTNTTPADGATGVAAGAKATATFSRAMDAATITASSFTLKRSDGTAVAAAVAYDATTRTATLAPSALLADATTYTAGLETTITASDGAPLAARHTWSFTTASQPQLATVRINAGGGAYTTAAGEVFAADASFMGGGVFSSGSPIAGTAEDGLYQDERWGQFSYAIPVPNGTYDVKLHFVEIYFGTAAPGAIGSRVFGMDVEDTPASPDLANIDVYAEVGANAALVKTVPAVTVSDGVLNLRSVYETADDPEVAAIEILPSTAPPQVTGTSPASGATGVGLATTVGATFSQALDPATMTASSFTLKRPDGTAVPAAVTYDGTTRTATLAPSSPLVEATTYTAGLETTITASDGTPLAARYTWSFTTGTTIRINAGGGAYTAAAGEVFAADASFTGGGVYSSGSPIAGTAEDGLYQDERWGQFSYAIPVPNGTYDVKLHFVEMYFGTAAAGGIGSRVFGIDVQDTTASPDLANIDVYAEVGPNAALVKTVEGVTVSDGVLDIRSVYGTADDPEVAAIEVVPSSSGSAPPSPAAQLGEWSEPVSWPLVAVHMSVLPTGNVLAFDGFDAAVNSERVWNPATGAFTPVPYGRNLFCAGHLTLADGRTFIVGGHEQANVGLADTTLFDAAAQAWSRAPDMAVTRWYPTATTLPDGRVLVFSGDNIVQDQPAVPPPFSDSSVDSLPEVYDPVTNTWSSIGGAKLSSPLYPFMFVLSDGRVLVAGPDTTTRILDPSSWQWSTVGQSPTDGYSAVMYRPDKLMKAGTWADPDFRGALAFAAQGTTGVLDMTQASPAWRTTASMHHARAYHNLTVLPDGTVLASGGGTASDGTNVANAVLPSEIWNPETETWTEVAPLQRGRLYHSTALLLQDGRVLMAGSGALPDTDAVDEKTAEIYSPPYLFKGARPTISAAPSVIAHGRSFSVDTPDAASIEKVVLVRLPSSTHGFVQDQRYVPLTFTRGSGGLSVEAPASPNLVPPGHYYLFVLNDKGVPSVARIVRFPGPWEDAFAPSAPGTLTASPGPDRVTLSWQAATDDVGIGRYEVYRSTTAGFAPSLANRIAETTQLGHVDTGLTPGTYYYAVRAVDGAGNFGPASNEASATVDAQPPTVSVTEPAAGATLSATVTLSATAADDVGVAGVQFQVDGVALGAEDTTAPYSVSWDTTAATNAAHEVTAVARDAAGNRTTSASVSVTVSNAAPPPPPDGPVAAYAFDEGTGLTTADATGKGHIGTLGGGVAWTPTGHSGGALSFDGVDDVVAVADAVDLDLASGMTLEAWVKPTALGSTWRTVVIKEQASDLVYALYAHTDAALPSGHVFVGADTFVRGTTSLLLGEWTHLAVTYDGAALTLYVNGVQAATQAVSGAMPASAGDLKIGGTAIWPEWFEGAIDDVRVYDRALTAADIQADMARAVAAGG
jgi:hypothetical protein